MAKVLDTIFDGYPGTTTVEFNGCGRVIRGKISEIPPARKTIDRSAYSWMLHAQKLIFNLDIEREDINEELKRAGEWGAPAQG